MARRVPASGRLRDMAVLLPLLGLFLLMPPFITLFAVDTLLFGIPLLAVYLFGVWAGLIGVAAWLARRLDVGRDAAAATPDAGQPPHR